MPRRPERPSALAWQVFRASDAIRSGLVTMHQLRGSAWINLRRDIYADSRLELDHVLACRAVSLQLPPGALIAGPSAALLHGVEHAAEFSDEVHVASPRTAGLRSQRGLRVHLTDLLPTPPSSTALRPALTPLPPASPAPRPALAPSPPAVPAPRSSPASPSAAAVSTAQASTAPALIGSASIGLESLAQGGPTVSGGLTSTDAPPVPITASAPVPAPIAGPVPGPVPITAPGPAPSPSPGPTTAPVPIAVAVAAWALPRADPTTAAWETAAWLETFRAVGIVDSLLRNKLTTRDALAAIAARHAERPGGRRARWVFDLADPGAQSPPESELRVRLVLAGLPRPVAQYPVRLASGLVLHPDLAWPEFRVAVEYDGSWHADDEQLHRDRQRLNQLVGAGWLVLHVTSRRLRHDFPSFVREVQAALARRGLRR